MVIKRDLAAGHERKGSQREKERERERVGREGAVGRWTRRKNRKKFPPTLLDARSPRKRTTRSTGTNDRVSPFLSPVREIPREEPV